MKGTSPFKLIAVLFEVKKEIPMFIRQLFRAFAPVILGIAAVVAAQLGIAVAQDAP